MSNVSQVNKVVVSARDAAGSLVGKKVRFNNAYKDIGELFPNISPSAKLKVLADDENRVFGPAGERIIVFSDKKGNKGISAASRLDVLA